MPLNNLLEQLSREGKLDKVRISFQESGYLLDSIGEDIKFANKTKTENAQWCFVVLYQAMIKAAKAYLVSLGIRTKSGEQHKTMIRIMSAAFGSEHEALFRFFDDMRRKRNTFVYDAKKFITDADIERAFKGIKEFFDLVKNDVDKRNPQKKLL